MTRLSKQLRILAASVILALGAGATSSAYAGVFQVTPSGDGLAPTLTTPVNADSLGGASSTLLTYEGGGVYDAVGYIDFSAFSLAGNAIGANKTGLNFYYGLYATFNQTFSCPGALVPGSPISCTAQSISLNLYANPGDGNSYTQASLTGPMVTDSKVSAGDILLGTSTVITGPSSAGINSDLGAFENLTSNFSLTSAGSAFFTAPVPFYDIAFSEYNNTSTGLNCSPVTGECAVTFETGSTNFAQTPEPASVAIFGLGLIGLAFMRRKSL